MESDNIELKSVSTNGEIDSTIKYLSNTLNHDMTQDLWNWEFYQGDDQG